MAEITSPKHLNTRRERTYPRAVKRARHNSYPVKKPGQQHPPRGTRHHQTRQPSPDQAKDQHRRVTKNKLSDIGSSPQCMSSLSPGQTRVLAFTERTT